MTKNLEITMKLEGDTFCVEMYEPESGDFTRIEHTASKAGLAVLGRRVSGEILGWYSLMSNELKEVTA